MSGNYIFFSGLLLIASSTLANNSDSCFNLMDYVPPAFNYHLLELTPDFSINGRSTSNNQRYKYQDTDTTYIIHNSQNRSNYPHFNIRTRYGFYGWKGSTEWQINSNASVYGQLEFDDPQSQQYNAHTQYSYIKYRDGSVNGNFSISANHYFRWPFFIGTQISPDIQTNSHYRNSVSKYYDTYTWDDSSGWYNYSKQMQKNKNYNISLTGYFRLGAGHIDDISFAVAALNMLDRISENENSFKGYNTKSLQDLAALIEKLRKRRAFDSRIAFIKNIDTLCSFIKKNGISDEISPRTVMELADQWNYAFYQRRNRGFSVVLYPSAVYSKLYYKTNITLSSCEQKVVNTFEMKDNDKNDLNGCNLSSEESVDWDRTNRMNYGINFLARYEKPLSRYFQLSLSSQATAISIRNRSKEWISKDTASIEYNYVLPEISLSEYAGLTYYPNTRTSIGISESVGYNRKFEYSDMEWVSSKIIKLTSRDNFDRKQLNISLEGNIIYYFSPQLQANFNVSIYNNDNYQGSYGKPQWFDNAYEYGSSETFNYSIGANLTWKIF